VESLTFEALISEDFLDSNVSAFSLLQAVLLEVHQ
jgi:hypothetical protein